MAKDNMSEEDQIKALEDLGFVVEDEEQDAGVDEKSLKDLGFVIEDEDAVAQAEEPDDAISTQMYSGMTFTQARNRYDEILKSPDVTPAPKGVGYAVYKDPSTGRQEYIPRPAPRFFGKDGLLANTTVALKELVTGDLEGAKAAYDDTSARVTGFDKVALGLGESAGGVVEAGAAVAEKAGVEGAVDAVQPLVTNIDTGDSFTDAILTDAVPAAAAAIGVGGVMTTAVKGYPLLIRALGTVVPAELAASLTTSTEEGNLLLGEDAAFSIAKGIDLGDEQADGILEQRINALGEGLALTSAISGVLPVGAKIAELGGKFALFPIYAAVVGGSAMERRVFERIADQLALIDNAASPEQIMQARRAVAETIRANKDIIVPMLTKLDEDQTITLDTVSALLRGTDDPASRATAGGILQGQLQRGGKAPQTIAQVEAPQAQLQAEMDAYLKEVGGETSADQTATMGKAADVIGDQAREAVAESDVAVVAATKKFDDAADKVVQGFKDDLEFGQKIEQLEDLVGTELVTGQTTSFQAVRNGLKNAYKTMTERKNQLYGAIPEGTPFDYETFGKALKDATADANDFDDTGKRLLGNRLISTLRKAYGKTERIELDAFGAPTDATQALPIEQVVKEIAASGVDFKVLYNTIRPEISKLVDEAFTNGSTEVGRRLLGIKKAIDDQVEWIAQPENGGQEAAEAAIAARDYYKGTADTTGYASIWRDGGKMEEFGDLYDPVYSRGTGEAGFQEGSGDLITDILSGRNADAVANMSRALEQVGDSGPVADYMIQDVISSFAGEIRGKGLSGASLANFSEKLGQYSRALNEVFPDRAARVNQFIRSVNQAAGNKVELEQALQVAMDAADTTRSAIKESELGLFLRDALGKEFDTTTGPYNAFRSIFQDAKDGVGKLTDLKARLASLPEAKRKIVQDGMEAAYMRLLKGKVNAAKMESGGSQSLKTGNVDGLLQESDQILEIGRLVFSDKSELMDGLSDLLEVSRMIGRGKGATPVAAMSPTAFNVEATKATNRLIMTFIGPLTRTGARVRAIAGGVFDAIDPSRRAEIMLDNIFANPDKYLELSKLYDIDPMNPAIKENLITGLTTGFLKGANADITGDADQNNVDQQMMDLLPQ